MGRDVNPDRSYRSDGKESCQIMKRALVQDPPESGDVQKFPDYDRIGHDVVIGTRLDELAMSAI